MFPVEERQSGIEDLERGFDQASSSATHHEETKSTTTDVLDTYPAEASGRTFLISFGLFSVYIQTNFNELCRILVLVVSVVLSLPVLCHTISSFDNITRRTKAEAMTNTEMPL